jgi:hypothetical protein
MSRRGVYFLASDGILDLAIAFLNSFRAHNPSTALCLIPFDNEVERVSALRDRFGFTLWPDETALQRCDAISRSFHDRTAGQYRKLAMWDGPFDEFAYIDCDTVVLHSVDFVFAHLARYGFVTSHSDMADLRRWVWRDSVYETGALTDKQISYSANTGFLASRRECLPSAQVAARLPDAVALAGHMELFCFEQPLLNYLMVTSGHPYSSLYTIAMTTGAWDIPMERWAGDPSFEVFEGRVLVPEAPSLLMHWAGEWSRARDEDRQIPYHELWNFYRFGSTGRATAGQATAGQATADQATAGSNRDAS